MKLTRQLVMFILPALFISCGGYRHPDFVIRTPPYYANRAQSGPLTVVADPYLTEGKEDMLFNYYPSKKGVYPGKAMANGETGQQRLRQMPEKGSISSNTALASSNIPSWM